LERFVVFEQLIFASETTKAMNREWHEGHFACFQCDKALAGCRYVIRDGNAYCASCYETIFCHKCEACGELIGVGSRVRPTVRPTDRPTDRLAGWLASGGASFFEWGGQRGAK